MPDQQKGFAERDIFGSDSELSDAPDVDEEEIVRRPQQPLSPSPAEGEESSGDSAEEYVQERSAVKKKRRTKRRGVGEDGRRPAAPKKRKRKQMPTEQDLDDLPPEQGALWPLTHKSQKMRLDMQIDAILKSKKTSRPKKRKKDEDVLDRFADEEVSRLREAMLSAADDDDKANRDKLPATGKLRLLPQVMEVLRKSGLSQSIADNNLLEGVRRWLEPLPDRSLPALNIQKEFLETLHKLEYIDTNVLKESKLGRVVLFYTKCKRITPDVARIANALVSTWSRPIIKRSASYRDRAIPIAADDLDDGQTHRGERLNAILARAKEGEKSRVRKNAVMIPQRELGMYTVAPRSNTGIMKNSVSVEMDTERRKRNADRMRSLTRKMSQKTSNYEDGEELEWEWKPEQTLLLSRTLDALPAHLLTPFNGPVPPSNLLDKIARGVVQAKGASEWPHSIRATRSKLVELSRQRAKEAAEEKRRDTIEEEDFPYGEVLQQTTNTGPRRLYRQSSMDFMQSAKLEIGDSDPFSRCVPILKTSSPSPSNLFASRVSNCLQRTDRMFPNPTYHHPYAHPSSRPPSPQSHLLFDHSLNPSTPSSTTLRTNLSTRSSKSSLHRTASTLSNSSDVHALPLYDPLAKSIRRTDSYGSLRQPLKRAPSYGVPKKPEPSTVQQRDSLTDPSSDEEEKLRAKTAKKARKQSDLPSSSIKLSTIPDSDAARKSAPRKMAPKSSTVSKAPAQKPAGPQTRPTLHRANLQRNPSILGPELPHPQPNLEPAFMRKQIPVLEPQAGLHA
ncbi:hypothetical protein EW146_g10137, partial [Bondarzewia mesenterica]